MSSADRSDAKAPSKSPPLSPKSAHFATLPPLKLPDALGSLSATPEAEDKSLKKQEKKLTSSSAPLSNAVSPASIYSVSPASGLNGQLSAGPTVINKQLLSKLNKSLKEKQKVISAKELHVRNPTLIQDVMSPNLQQSFNVSGSSSSEIGIAPSNIPLNESMDLDRADPDINSSNGGLGKDDASVKAKSKQVAKQNSTRTDFFAAKLAIAVDDVESSDSDETFIYETNVNEYGENEPAGLPPTIPNEEQKRVDRSSNTDTASQIPSQTQPANDTSSLSGSVRVTSGIGSHANSPTTEIRRDDDLYSFMTPLTQPSVTKAESIHSLQSLKYNLRNTFNTTPPAITNGRSQSVNHSSHSTENPVFSNPYFDNHQRDSPKGSARDGVSPITSGDEKNIRYSISHYGDSTLLPYRMNENLTNEHNINEPFADGNYSYDEDDGVSGDDASSHGDINLVCTDVNASNVLASSVQRPNDLVSVSSKAKKNKSSTNSSKLRSTTSKLFDKKGAQPRRYSTIPDDIDIEDFDDELIYYDNNNIRFPYGNHNEISNETSSLVSGPKIPHYRSLNLNFGTRKPSKHIKGQRYLSLGYVPSPQTNGNKRNDIFPFPYLENEPPYLDFDEYDEDPEMGKQDLRSKRIASNRTNFSSGSHMIPRYSSQDLKKGGRGTLFKTVMFFFVAISFILSLGFALGFLLASTKNLSNVSIVSIENPLVSQDELVFSIVVEALNPGWFTISITDLELDIFAKSGYLGDESIESSLETVLLGSVLNFESAVNFEGLFFHRKLSRHTGEIKLVSPGKNITSSKLNNLDFNAQSTFINTLEGSSTQPDNSEKWAIISKHPFDLILRGVLKYNLPLTSAQRTVVVNKVGYVDPSVPN